MDEDEAASVMQSQLEAEEWFGSTSYASFQVPAPTTNGGSNAMTAKAFQAAILTDSDSSAEEDDADYGDDLVSPHENFEGTPARTLRSQSSAVSIARTNTNSGLSSPLSGTPTSPGGSFIPGARSRAASRSGGPVISSARAKPTSSPQQTPEDLEPPPMLSALASLPPPLELPKPPLPTSSSSSSLSSYTSSSTASSLHASTAASNADDEPPPPLRLPDLPADMPVFRPSSQSLRVVGSLGLPSPVSIPAPIGAGGAGSAPGSPLSPVMRSNSGPLSSPRASSHMIGKLSLSGGSNSSTGSDKTRARPYNPSALPNGVLQGQLYLQSPQLPFPGWIVVECSLVGGQLRWQCQEPQCYGLIELSTVTKVARSKQGLELLGAGFSSFAVTTPTELWYIAAQQNDTTALWRDAVEFHAPGTSAAKKKVKKPKTEAPVSNIALSTVKARMDSMAPLISTATFNLLRLFFHGKYTFVKAIFAVIQVTEADKVSASLARIFFFADIPLQLIKSVIDWEVERTTIVNQLFRQDSIASKVMTAYTRLIAQPYLVSTLKSSVQRIAKCGKELEINPESLGQEERDAVGSRVFLLQSIVTELLDTIRQSIHLVPTECRLICLFLKQAVSGKFSDEKATEISLAGYLFLRMINPALVVPDSIGIIDKAGLSPDGRRALLLVSKIVLNMANQVEFHKEPYLIPFNDFLKERLPTVQQFIHECADVPPEAVMTATNLPPPKMVLDELALLYKILYPLQEKLSQALADEPKVLKRFNAAFAAIGPPAQPAPLPTEGKESKKDKKSSNEKEEAKRQPLPAELMHFASKSATSH